MIHVFHIIFSLLLCISTNALAMKMMDAPMKVKPPYITNQILTYYMWNGQTYQVNRCTVIFPEKYPQKSIKSVCPCVDAPEDEIVELLFERIVSKNQLSSDSSEKEYQVISFVGKTKKDALKKAHIVNDNMQEDGWTIKGISPDYLKQNNS